MKTLAVYPKREILQLLAKSKGRCVVYTRTSVKPLTALYIQFNGTITIKVTIDYNDVYFKFECFSLKLTEVDYFLDTDVFQKISDIKFEEIKAYIRYNWERPILPEEDNPYKSSTIIESGRKQSIPVSAIGLCSSIVGLVFFNSEKKPVLLIAHDIESTVEMIVSQDIQKIYSYIEEHENVPIDNIDSWYS